MQQAGIEDARITRLTESRGLDDYPSWSPDGKQNAFTSRRDGNPDIFVMRSDGSNPRNITRGEGMNDFPTWSPTGELTFCSLRDGTWDLYRLRP